MRTLLVCTVLLAVALIAKVQAQSVEERGPNHRSVSRRVPDGRGGEVSTPAIVVIETGMNAWDEEQRDYLPSEARFELTQQGFVARRLQHRVRLDTQLNVIGAVTVALPSGTRLSSTPVGIALADAASGDFLVIAGLTNSTGVQISEDQILYPDAFHGAGVCADVLYTVEKGTFAQDIIFTGRLDPMEWGFPRETTRIEILTEFYGAPEPERIRRPVYIEADEKVRARMASPDLMDETLGFSEFVLGQGSAYTMPSDLAPEGTVAAVAKQFLRMGDGGRVFLVESVPYAWLEKGFASLPACTLVTGALKPRGTMEKAYAALPKPPQVAQTLPQVPVVREVAAALRKPRGVVIDYIGNIGGSMSGTTVFSSYTNYFVSGAVYCNGAVVIEGGTVFKYPTNASRFMQFNNTVTCKTGNARMAVFTAVDDDSVGDSCNGVTNSGYTGVINTNGYADPAIRMGLTTLTLSNVRFSYAKRAIQYFGAPVAVTLNVLYPH